MLVAWVSHQWPDTEPRRRGPGLLSGRHAGGAEMTTDEMLTQRPADVELLLLDSRGDLGRAAEADVVVVAATELLPDGVLPALAELRPVVWMRSPQRPAVRPLVDAAGLVLWASHEMARSHGWRLDDYRVCSAPLDPTEVPRGVPKEPFALWAARDIWHKGRDAAREWAADAGVELVELSDVPRSTVLEHMGRARWFVHLPVGFVDPCPRTVIEAEIAGCELVVNDRVGRVPVRGADAVAEYVAGAAERFWGWVRQTA